MKKTYILPTMKVEDLGVTQIIALSLKDGQADDSDALVKSNDNWDIWSSEEE
ncbi:MAG: hypothetical protein J5545_06285 [Bacteroidaceae bacterium]|nr:hypothetical protein [Bacteroidaceae bacterium]